MIVAEFDNVCKRYTLQPRRKELVAELFGDRLRRLLGRGHSEGSEFYALRDVSFRLERGDSLGIVGANGAGKSTALKLLAGITRATSGAVRVHGRAAALIEIGAGFHGDLSGRENIYLYGNIMGMRRREIDQKFEAIVAFAELQAFIDQPVKRYSSGMYARLGFSVVAHLDPDLLLVDEVLAVGDMAFQRKCLQRMRELQSRGCALVFVSHNLGAVEAVCGQSLWLHEGRVQAYGPTREILNRVMHEGEANRDGVATREFEHRSGSGEAMITHVEIQGSRNGRPGPITTGGPVNIKIGYEAFERIVRPTFAVVLFSDDGVRVCSTNTRAGGNAPEVFDRGGTVICRIPHLWLVPGRYHLRLSISDEHSVVHYDFLPRVLTFTVEADPEIARRVNMDRSWGVAYFPAEWEFEGAAESHSDAAGVRFPESM